MERYLKEEISLTKAQGCDGELSVNMNPNVLSPNSYAEGWNPV